MREFHKPWQVETQGHIYEAEFEELLQWIAEGAVLPTDRVRRGNLRWLPAEKVPELYNFFNANPDGAPASAVAPNNYAAKDFGIQSPFESPAEDDVWPEGAERVCYKHEDAEAAFACDICKKFFCKTCPNSYGGVKLCPLCGAMTRPADQPTDPQKSIGAIYKPYSRAFDEAGNPRDEANEHVPIYRDPVILIMTAIMFTAITVAAVYLFYTTK